MAEFGQLKSGNELGEPRPIDVKELIGRLSHSEILEAADKYFSGMTENSEQCFKPFSNPQDSVQLLRNFSLLLQAADVYVGADVLDFGCGTGWATLALADMGARVVGIDVSPAAIRLAELVKNRRPQRVSHRSSFATYGGLALPYPDDSFDRILCFDAFHHVADQAFVLREFARILRPGGRVAMLEPGPHHSLAPQSQAEMARYSVIENDICLSEIGRHAIAVGLDAPRVLVQFPAPLDLDTESFHRWAHQKYLRAEDSKQLIDWLQLGLTDTQCFYCTKGAEALDSRRVNCLGGEISLQYGLRIHPDRAVFRFFIELLNSGKGAWLGAVPQAGQVNLGIQLLDARSSVHLLDFQRVALPVQRVNPGEKVSVDFEVDLTAFGPDVSGLRFDLVSEEVAWFGSHGASSPVDWRLEEVFREA